MQDGPSAQIICCGGDKIPSFLPNGVIAGCSAEYNIRVAEATILRKAECIVITWCSTVTSDYNSFARHHVSFCVYRGGEVVVDFKIPLPDHCYEQVRGQIVFCVTLRRKHHIVKAIKRGDKLGVFISHDYHRGTTIVCTLEANV